MLIQALFPGLELEEMTMNTRVYRAVDDHNIIPEAVLEWQGPGWYAARYSRGICSIVRLPGAKDWPPIVLPEDGYDTPAWAETVEEAFGAYARHGRISRAWEMEAMS